MPNLLFDPNPGVKLTPLESMVPVAAGLTAAIVLAVMTCYCARRIRQRNRKTAGHDATLPFQPPRRPTAVRSPSGAPPHYLKKSPSPTGTKPPPGAPLSPPEAPTQVRYAEESETGPLPRMVAHETRAPEPESPVGGDQGDCGEYGRLGTLVFKLRFLADKGALVVSVVRCRGLPGKGGTVNNGDLSGAKNTGNTDPYVKLQLLPEKQHKVKTRVVRNTRNPVYDEDFTFYGLSLTELGTMSLHFVVLSFDRYSRDDVIGEVICPMSSMELSQIENQQVAFSKEIQPRSLKIRAQGRGELLISLCWQPAAARLTVVLLKARNLPRMDVTGLADPYVKIYLLYNGQRIAKKKTHVKKRTLSPVFNESFAFDIPTTEGAGATLDGVALELMLLDWDRVTKNEVIGRLDLGGPRCTGTTLNHWNEVCNSPRRQIAEWHKLVE
ncbi:synaptotagmin-11 [Phlebotomus papatasi]|uniref:synaptotagmin-11 n=1 Tax=Phlebotomus papatasi TaxID=29031 RepID=UPI0024845E19|nr:synaptotagmin-11 [Phlebotomus papatasi]